MRKRYELIHVEACNLADMSDRDIIECIFARKRYHDLPEALDDGVLAGSPMSECGVQEEGSEEEYARFARVFGGRVVLALFGETREPFWVVLVKDGKRKEGTK